MIKCKYPEWAEVTFSSFFTSTRSGNIATTRVTTRNSLEAMKILLKDLVDPLGSNHDNVSYHFKSVIKIDEEYYMVFKHYSGMYPNLYIIDDQLWSEKRVNFNKTQWIIDLTRGCFNGALFVYLPEIYKWTLKSFRYDQTDAHDIARSPDIDTETITFQQIEQV